MKFGVAGYPLAFTTSPDGKKREKIFPWLKSLGLNALELQMTYGPRTKEETCIAYKALAEEYGITLSVHASYFIVLTSDDEEKIVCSIETLTRTFELAELLGAKHIILHPGPLYKEDAPTIQQRFIKNCTRFWESYTATHAETAIGLYIETAGKVGQLGSVEEILTMSAALPRTHPCTNLI